MKNEIECREKTEDKAAMMFSAIIALCSMVGRAMNHTNKIQEIFKDFNSVVESAFTFFVSFFVAFTIFIILLKISDNERLKAFEFGKKFFKGSNSVFYFWFIFFLAFGTCFLAYYPGVYSYDIQAETPMALGYWAITTQHPPLHVFLWKLFLILEEKTGLKAVSTYALVSMLFLSYSFARIEKCVVIHSHSMVLPVLSMLILLSPTFAIMSIIPVKDTIFAGFFAINNVNLVDIVLEKKADRKKQIQYAVSLLFCCLFRNNAFAVYLVIIPIFFFSKVQYGKNLAGCSALAVLVFFTITNFIYPKLGVVKARDAEKLSIPIHQVSTAVVNHALSREQPISQEDVNELNHFIPPEMGWGIYNPRLVDPIKYAMNFNEPNSTERFIKLWLKMGKEYPLDYLNGFLTLNLPYWYPLSTPIDEFSNRTYIETELNIDQYYSYDADSKLPFAKKCYESIAKHTQELTEKVPILKWLLSLSLPFIILSFCFFMAYAKQPRLHLLIILPSFLYWGTFLTGPVSIYRYVFPIMVLYPLFFLSSFKLNEDII